MFSATHMSRQKTYNNAFASADAKLCEAFFDKLNPACRCTPGFIHLSASHSIFTVLYTVIYQFASCALALFVCVGLGVSILYALILGFVLFCGYGVYRGHSLREMLSLALSGIRTVKGILLTFPLIGVITALWRRSGTIAFIICRALDLCGERVMLPAAFLLWRLSLT